MVQRVLKVIDTTPKTLEDLFEDLPEKSRYTYTEVSKNSILNKIQHLNKVEDSEDTVIDSNTLKMDIIEMLIGLIILGFGVFNASSIFSDYTEYNGFMATFFYLWQFAWIFEIVGCIMIYDGLKRESKTISNLLAMILSIIPKRSDIKSK